MKAIELNNAQVLSIVEGLSKLQDEELKLSAIVAYKIIKNLKLLAPSYQAINETKNDLIRKYAQDGSESLEPGTEEFDNFLKDFNPILLEKDSPLLETITIDSLEGAQMSVRDMAILDFMIEDEEASKDNTEG